jgi:hypothetical protein
MKSYLKVDDSVSYTLLGIGDYYEGRSEHTIKGLEIVCPDSLHDVSVPFTVKPNQSYYLVYGLFKTENDSLLEENRIDFVSVFETENDASYCRQKLQDVKASAIMLLHGHKHQTLYIPAWLGSKDNALTSVHAIKLTALDSVPSDPPSFGYNHLFFCNG